MMRACGAALVLVASVSVAVAQEAAAPPQRQPASRPAEEPALRLHRFTISGGLSWIGGYPLGGHTATLRRNEAGTPTPSAFMLFRADASIEQASTLEARLGYAVTRELAVEIGGSFGKPQLALAFKDDLEGDAVTLRDEVLSQHAIDGSVVWQIPNVRVGRRAKPYLTAGGGYLRQLYAENTVIETGRIMHVGGGVRYWLVGGDAIRRPIGVRIETRLQVRTGGVDLENKRRTFPVFNIFGFFGF